MGVKALTDNLIFSIRNAAFSPQDYLQRKEHRVTTLSLPKDKTPPQLQPAACACSEDIMQLEDRGDKQLLFQPQALSMNPEEFPPLIRGMEPVSPSRDSDLESDTSPFLALPQSFTEHPPPSIPSPIIFSITSLTIPFTTCGITPLTILTTLYITSPSVFRKRQAPPPPKIGKPFPLLPPSTSLLPRKRQAPPTPKTSKSRLGSLSDRILRPKQSIA
ncbi:hypothetical protein AAFF_G00333530 [Aldrovandia affinis]|uniref:Uncharacterized protein n=1 Tax=Aldrovandia affinis TaxID=143900 RepID=A0AAD7W0H1_9TELE|nr:hypothetical protein AAFF_G00333530 [Aldrovandia affinis]